MISLDIQTKYTVKADHTSISKPRMNKVTYKDQKETNQLPDFPQKKNYPKTKEVIFLAECI